MQLMFFGVLTIALWHSTAAYTAAVVEYASLTGNSRSNTVELNINEYVNLIKLAQVNNVDIVVFPEYGLTGWYKDPVGYEIEVPSNSEDTKSYHPWLQRLSKAASEHSIYVVVNVVEKELNESNKTLYYNTNVIFNRKGSIITKYRKMNLYFEPKITAGNELITFTTDFGVTFGIFICFDLLFYNPSTTILSKASDIIFTTAWVSYMPFLPSLSSELGYATVNKINLLAANLNNPTNAGGGSGIYTGGEALSYYISGQNGTKMLISEVNQPGTHGNNGKKLHHAFDSEILNTKIQSDVSDYRVEYYLDHADSYITKTLDLSKKNIDEKLCDGSFCCNLVVNLSPSEVNRTEIYQFIVFDGETELAETRSKFQVCALLSCETLQVNTCGTKDNRIGTTKFKEITVSGEFNSQPGNFYRPTSVKSNLLPIFNTTFSVASKEVTDAVKFSTKDQEGDIKVFGIFGRGDVAPGL